MSRSVPRNGKPPDLGKRAKLNERMPWPEPEPILPRMGTSLSNIHAQMGGAARHIKVSQGSNRSPR
jgi:hypothetical protein